MTSFEEFCSIIARLRAPDGCPWDKVQTHASLKGGCIEEAAEVVGGINILEATGDPENLKEELGDLLLQIVMQARIAEEEGLFTMDDVIQGITEKMIRRHPHVFGRDAQAGGGPKGESEIQSAGDRDEADAGQRQKTDTPEKVLIQWDEIKRREKAGKEWMDAYLPEAFREGIELLQAAEKRKREKWAKAKENDAGSPNSV